MLLSFIVPVAPYHVHLLDRARGQVEKQTLPCAFIPYVDTEGKGAGFARNRGVEKASTPYIAFLDCDDYLDPTYAEKMLSVYQPGHYVYCDFYMAGEIVQIADNANLKEEDAHHLINCVLSRDVFWQIGGFDEHRQMEDTLFWAKCLNSGVCGIRCPYPLVEYTGDGQRSSKARQRDGWIREYWNIFREYPSMCCGHSTPMQSGNMGEQQPGDVLAYALWGGNRRERGAISGRVYPRTGNMLTLWVDPRDVEAQPLLFRAVPIITPDAYNPDLETVQALVAEKLKVTTDEKPAGKHPDSVQPKTQKRDTAGDIQRKSASRGKAASPNSNRRNNARRGGNP